MTTENIDKLLLKIPEVVQATGYSRSFIYEAIAAGSLKVVRKGRTIRVRAEDLKAWIEDQE
ncbi:MAG: helix-turn-helix domain-containing protein [Dehalococcoidia bacterium]|jgi:excisionase family DNA binding protein|nr:helix-turn-helix domain-containing protein [Dehalococcoidia bacterium]MDP7200537.1 helix-turn-helix domain-containing protein [Dehalococcoidia bacterium]